MCAVSPLAPHGWRANPTNERSSRSMLRGLRCMALVGIIWAVGVTIADAHVESIDELTRQLLTLNAKVRLGDAAALAALENVAAARQARLEALIAEHPELVLRGALSATARASLPPSVQPRIEEAQSLEGDLEILH